MSFRGRERYVVYASDEDDGSYYEELSYPPPKRARSRLRVDVKDERLRSPARREKVYATRPYVPQTAVEPETIIIENTLNVPQQGRARASSTGAAPQPNLLQPIYLQQPSSRDPSRERHRHYRYEYSESDDSDDHRSRRKHRRGKSGSRSEIDPDLAIRLAKLELMEEQHRKGQLDATMAERLARLKEEKKERDPELAIRLAKLELLEEQNRKGQLDAVTAERLARLKNMEEKRERDQEEATIIARMEDKKRREKQKEEAFLLEYQERQRKEEEAEKAAIAQAEAKRMKKEAEMKAERDRLLLLEKEKAAREKAERHRIISEEREKIEREKREAEEERKRIILEEELRRKKEKEEQEELRKKILAEEEAKRAQEKAKKKKEEDEFQLKVKERFMKAGYSPDYIEDILDSNRRDLVRTTSHRTANSLALDISRPTYIRVKLEHLYPETLDKYQLPWDYDPDDERYILIKEYISHDLQQELFEHTRKLKIRREKLLITDGYVKDTVTTLKPRNVYKDKNSDELYVVRRKSASKSPARRSWMFT